MEIVWIALGSNLAKPQQQVKTAIAALADIPDSVLVACSSWYRSRPLGPENQPDFLNVVVAMQTTIKPEQLLDYIQYIELQQGRIRHHDQRWGPRTIDIDILLFGNCMISTPRLTVPHYDMYNREFILYPLAELVPNLRFPNGETLADNLQKVPLNNLSIWDNNQQL